MNAAVDKIDIYLRPGEFHFAGQETRISTLLGSCVAIVLWHPTRLIGGMCHYMLPCSEHKADPQQLNGKYAEDAINMFLQEIKAAGTSPAEYQVKIFGGGNMFPDIVDSTRCDYNIFNCNNSSSCRKVGCRNVLTAYQFVEKYRLKLINHDVGGIYHRKVIFDIWTGNVWLRKG